MMVSFLGRCSGAFSVSIIILWIFSDFVPHNWTASILVLADCHQSDHIAGDQEKLKYQAPFFDAMTTERSFIMIKPDGVQRGLVPEILSRFQKKGYKLVGLKMLKPTAEVAAEHYIEHKERSFFKDLLQFIQSGPVVACVFEGKSVVEYSRTMIGATNPLTSAPGTIRGDFGIDIGRNLIHGSDSLKAANREIALWFKPEELCNWSPDLSKWIYE